MCGRVSSSSHQSPCSGGVDVRQSVRASVGRAVGKIRAGDGILELVENDGSGCCESRRIFLRGLLIEPQLSIPRRVLFYMHWALVPGSRGC
jgi:hypothetical protein